MASNAVELETPKESNGEISPEAIKTISLKIEDGETTKLEAYEIPEVGVVLITTKQIGNRKFVANTFLNNTKLVQDRNKPDQGIFKVWGKTVGYF